MTMEQHAAHYDIPLERFTVNTEEGERIACYRIPNPGKPVVIMQHGLMGNSRQFIYLGKESIAYRVWSQGFDVWLTNTRENGYSRSYQDTYKWDYTWEDLALVDMPQVIDYILKETSQEQLIYIGHSQGGRIIYSLLSEKIEYNEKVKLFAALAPGMFIYNESWHPLKTTPAIVFEQLAEGRVQLPQLLITYTCAISETLCWLLMSGTFIPEEPYFSYMELASFAMVASEPTSATNLRCVQSDLAQEQQKLFKKNGEWIDISKITAKNALFVGKVDRLTPYGGQLGIMKRLTPGTLIYKKFYQTDDHFSFWMTRKEDFFKDLAELLQPYTR